MLLTKIKENTNHLLNYFDDKYKLILTFLFFLAFLYFLFRGMGLYPMIFGDEYSYNLLSRIIPIHQVDDFRPNYLYFNIYSLSSLCGDSFLECTRLFNILFFLIGCFFLFMLSKLFLSEKSSLLVAFIVFISPSNSYTLFFMPESTYFCFLWLYFYVLIKISFNNNLYLKIIVPPLFLCLLSLIKPHGFFLIFTLIVPYINLIDLKSLNNNFKPFTLFLLSILCFYFINRLFSFAYTGELSNNLFGSEYKNYASDIFDLNYLINRISLTIYNLFGHLLSLIFLFAIPIYMLLKNYNFYTSAKLRSLLFTFLISIFSLLFIITNFQAQIINSGIYESILRLSMRHYDFLFPFFILFSFISLTKIDSKYSKDSYFFRFVFIVFFIILIYVSFSNFGGFTPWLADAPFFVALHNKHHFLIFFGVLILLSFTLLRINKKYALIFYLINFVGISFFTNTYIHYGVKGRIQTDSYDKAGIMINKIYPQITDRVLFVGQDEASLMRSLFYLHSKSGSFKPFKLDSYLENEQIKDYNWIVLIGNYSFDNNFYDVIFETKYNDNHDKITLIKLREISD